MADGATAVVGVACIFPGAATAGAFWRNICAGTDATSAPPAARLDPVFREVAGTRIDRLGCWRGGFIDAYARFDPYKHGMMPRATKYAEPEQLLALEVSAQALSDAGYGSGRATPTRAAVVVGRGNYASSARSRFEQAIRGAEQLVTCLRELFPDLSREQLERVRGRFQAALEPPERDAVANLVPNLVAARIAERFDFNGPAYTIDAACASSLLAVEHTCASLQRGEVDLALAGGVHLCHAEDFWSVFSQVGLLSASGVSRPLDRRADGLLIGEGVGFVVLKREVDAARDGDRIYATIHGSGSSSDGRGTSVIRPSTSGQLRALERAWGNSGRDPSEVELIEAHATGTQTGDAAEVDTIVGFFGAKRTQSAVVGSVKSMIGHTMPAAGIAGLIKSALAIHHRTLPPTLNCQTPRGQLSAAGFQVLDTARAWESRWRKTAVSAFGFGGINVHVVLGTPGKTQRRVPRAAAHAGGVPELALYAAPTKQALLQALLDDSRDGEGTCRAIVLNPNAATREHAVRAVARSVPTSGRSGVFHSDRGLLRDGRLACIFPGLDAFEQPRLAPVRAWLGEGSGSAHEEPSLEGQGRALLAANRTLYRALLRIGVRFDMFAGHSLGEWNAMEAAGICEEQELCALAAALRPGTVGAEDVAFIAIGASAAVSGELISAVEGAVVSHDNCPHQSVVACKGETAQNLLQACAQRGLIAQRLPFGSGVHSPYFAPHLEQSLGPLATLRMRSMEVPVYSATTCEPYPDDALAIREVIRRHLLEPVRFRELVERLYADGVRVFLQAGGGALCTFVADTLGARPHVALSAYVREQPPLTSLLQLACSLWVECAPIEWKTLDGLCRLAPVDRSQPVVLGVPLVHFEPFIDVTGSQRGALEGTRRRATEGSVGALLERNLARIASVQRELVQARLEPVTPTPQDVAGSEIGLREQVSLETYPELHDHSFYRQPAAWPDVRDRAPVVPMTALLEFFGRAACARHAGDARTVELSEVWAKRWLNVSEPVDVIVRRRACADGTVDVTIDGFAHARLRVAPEYPRPRRYVPFALRRAQPSPVTAQQLYGERWMFHGPAYQSVLAIDQIGEDGICGTIGVKGGRGSLLDGAGQLLGLWLMLSSRRDRLAMPVRIGRLSYLAEEPAPGAALQCSARVMKVTGDRVVANMRIGCDERLWIEIEGWEDRRFHTDDRLWRMIRWPENTLLCDVDERGAVIAARRYESSNTFEMLLGQYLRHAERVWISQRHVSERWDALLRSVAAKDAARAFLKLRGDGPYFPVELEVQPVTGSSDRVVVAVNGTVSLSVGVESDGSTIRARVLSEERSA